MKYILLLALIPFLLVPFIPADALKPDNNKVTISVDFPYQGNMTDFIISFEKTTEIYIEDKVNSNLRSHFDFKYTYERDWVLYTDDNINWMFKSTTILAGDSSTKLTQAEYDFKYNTTVGELRTLLHNFLTDKGITSFVWHMHYSWGIVDVPE